MDISYDIIATKNFPIIEEELIPENHRIFIKYTKDSYYKYIFNLLEELCEKSPYHNKHILFNYSIHFLMVALYNIGSSVKVKNLDLLVFSALTVGVKAVEKQKEMIGLNKLKSLHPSKFSNYPNSRLKEYEIVTLKLIKYDINIFTVYDFLFYFLYNESVLLELCIKEMNNRLLLTPLDFLFKKPKIVANEIINFVRNKTIIKKHILIGSKYRDKNKSNSSNNNNFENSTKSRSKNSDMINSSLEKSNFSGVYNIGNSMDGSYDSLSYGNLRLGRKEKVGRGFNNSRELKLNTSTNKVCDILAENKEKETRYVSHTNRFQPPKIEVLLRNTKSTAKLQKRPNFYRKKELFKTMKGENVGNLIGNLMQNKAEFKVIYKGGEGDLDGFETFGKDDCGSNENLVNVRNCYLKGKFSTKTSGIRVENIIRKQVEDGDIEKSCKYLNSRSQNRLRNNIKIKGIYRRKNSPSPGGKINNKNKVFKKPKVLISMSSNNKLDQNRNTNLTSLKYSNNTHRKVNIFNTERDNNFPYKTQTYNTTTNTNRKQNLKRSNFFQGKIVKNIEREINEEEEENM